MPFTKEFIDVLLDASPDYDESMILDYNVLGANNASKMYADFAKANVENHKVKVEPFELFLLNYDEPNAWAWFHNDKNVICIHLSLFENIEKRVLDKIKSMPSNAKAIISKGNFSAQEPADYLIIQFATVFIFYHELAHLLQFNKGNKGAALVEKYNLSVGADFDKRAHAMEIDADIFAAEQMTAHLFQFWNKFSDENKTKDSLETLISLMLLSSFILFFELTEGWEKWYTFDYDHPNSIIRVTYILDALIQTSKAKDRKLTFEIDKTKILNDTFILANHFIDDSKMNGFEDFAKLFYSHQEDINNYTIGEMFLYMETIPFLNSNKVGLNKVFFIIRLWIMKMRLKLRRFVYSGR